MAPPSPPSKLAVEIWKIIRTPQPLSAEILLQGGGLIATVWYSDSKNACQPSVSVEDPFSAYLSLHRGMPLHRHPPRAGLRLAKIENFNFKTFFE